MEKNKILKFLIPVVAVVVILESVIIVSGLTKKKDVANNNVVTEQNTSKSTKTVAPKDAVASLIVGSESNDMKVGKGYKVTVKVSPSKTFTMDATDVYLKYDANAFEVGEASFNESQLGKPASSKISAKKGLVIVNYWISDPKGFTFENGKEVQLMSIDVTPKKAGNYNFEIATGDGTGESDTMIVESSDDAKASPKVLPFATEKLTVNVSN